MPKIISVTNEKGGCGKTTTAVNLAAIFAERGYRVLLIDADCQSYSTLYYGLYQPEQPSLYHVLFKALSPEKAISKTKFGVDVLRSSTELKKAEDELTDYKLNSLPYDHLLKAALSFIQNDYDFIFIDCPPQSYKLMEIIQAYSEYLILPMVPDEFAIHSLRIKAESLVEVRRTLNPQLQILGGLIVMAESGGTKTAYREALQNQRILPIFQTVIRKNVTLSRAINAHEPINVYARSSNGNKDYQELAKEILGRLQ